MKIPQIRIESQPAKIQIQQSDAVQQLEQPKARQSIHQPKADLTITTTPSKLTIDQSQAWKDMNLMPISKRIEKFAQEGRQGLLEGIQRRTAQGDELMRIENGGNPIVSQAIENGHDSMKSLGITFIPSPFSVRTSYQPAEVTVDVQVNEPIIDSQQQKPIHQYEPGKVEISLQQRADLQIDFVDIYV